MNLSPTKRPPHSGTRPEGTSDEQEAARRVREMFSGIAPRYDFLNHLLSLSFDRLWRRRTAERFREILARPDARVLDLCCGTGDLAFAMDRVSRQVRNPAGAGLPLAIGTDFAHPMLVRAREKARRSGSGVVFFEADALALPFPDASFDLVAAAFGFRNLANYERGLHEIHRVLRRGGAVAILEFCEPRSGLFGAVYRFYFERILPRVGGVISGSRATYAYLPSSVSEFPLPEALSIQMAHAGFADVRVEQWTGGIVALHTARCA